jgi:hypothetical protein
MTNVVHFPLEKRQQKIISEFEKIDNSILDLTDDLLSEILTILYEEGYHFDIEDYEYDTSFVFESIRSLLCKLNNIEHPLQEFCEEMFETVLAVNSEADKQLEFDI